MFSPDVVVKDSTVACPVDMWLLQVHSIALNGTRNAADEDYGPVRLHFLNDADMGQGIIGLSVTIEIPGVIKEDEVAWHDIRSPMQNAMLIHMVVDESDPVGIPLSVRCPVEIDAVFQIDGTGHSGTVVGDSLTLTRDGPCSDQPCCGLNDG